MVNENSVKGNIDNENVVGSTDKSSVITGGVVEVSVTGTAEEKIVGGTITSNSLIGSISGNNIEGTITQGGPSLAEETDPTVPGHVKNITEQDIRNWNNKVESDQIPTTVSQLTNDAGFITNNTKNLENYYLKDEIDEFAESLQSVKDVLVDGKSVVTGGKANIDLPDKLSQLTNDAGFITQDNVYSKEEINSLAGDFVNKEDVYSKEEINELAEELVSVKDVLVDGTSVVTDGKANIGLSGYATEKWVKNQDYMPIPDFQEYINYFHYTKTETDEKFNDYYNKEEIDDKDYVTMPGFREVMTTLYYNKEEIDTKLDELPTGGPELTSGDNTVIEENKINVYTNTGYFVTDKDIQLQSITDSETTGENKIVYLDEKEIVIIYDGTNKIRRSENGIDFDVITLPVECKYMVFNAEYNRLYGTDKSSNFIFSEDTGLTWQTINSTYASGLHQMAIGFGAGFRSTYKSTKEIINFTFNEATSNITVNSRIKSTIVPEFTEMVNNSQFVWCNSTGTFKYGAGSQEGNFASLSGITINLLKRVNNITILGLKNDNRIYLLEPSGSITTYKWIEYPLLDTCTVNDVIFNPNDETYYIFTDINTYYKTKDFIDYENVDKNSLRGIQGSFTLEGIQMTTSNHNELLLAPTRTKQENQNQNFKRLTKKELWVGKGLELEDGRFNVKSNSSAIGVSTYGLYITPLTEDNLSEQVLESLYVAKAEEKDLFDPVEMENWYFSDEAYPVDTNYKAVKFLFSQAGSFINMATWEDEIVVEQYEYGYLFYDVNMTIFKYVKLGNKSWMFE